MTEGIPWQGERYKAQLGPALADGLNAAVEYLLARTIPRMPIMTGAMRASMHTVHATADELTAVMEGSTPYIVIQHEALDFHHPEGEARFAAHTLSDERDAIQQIVAARLAQIR